MAITAAIAVLMPNARASKPKIRLAICGDWSVDRADVNAAGAGVMSYVS